ncbi:MAG: NigD-like protein [Prolixibacteraceae bacterium]
MKKYFFGILLLGLTVILTGCLEDEDSYSLGKMWVGFGVIEEVNFDPPDYKITLDNGDVLIPVASENYYRWYYTGSYDQSSRLKSGDRILINYTILDDKTDDAGEVEHYYIKVNSVKKILKKGILDITEENQDSIGNDPIIVKEVWMTDTLLNFEMKYWGRYKTHFINLVKQPGELTAADQPVELELRHNANDDVTDIPFVSFVSFDLNKLRIEGLDSVSFRVTAVDYDGETFEYEGVYDYSQN